MSLIFHDAKIMILIGNKLIHLPPPPPHPTIWTKTHGNSCRLPKVFILFIYNESAICY